MNDSMQRALDAALPTQAIPSSTVDLRRGFAWARELGAFPSPRWLVQGLIPEHALVLLYGESSTGKSTLAVDIGMRIATGRELLGRKCSRGYVVHIAGEGAEGLALRIRAHQKAHGLADDVPYVIVHRAIDLALDGDVKWITDTIAQLTSECGMEPALVIVDTLARCAGINENASDEMGSAIRACDRVRVETGATLMLVHHTGKDPRKGARGSYALHAAVDTEIEVQGTSGLRDARVTKQRDGTADVSWQFELRRIEIGCAPESGDVTTAIYVEHRTPAHGELRRRQESTGTRSRPRLQKLGKIQGLVVAVLREQADRKVLKVSKADILRMAGERHNVSRPASVYEAIKRLVSSGVLFEDDSGVGLAERDEVLPGSEARLQ